MLLNGRRLFGAVAGLSIDQLVAWGVLYYAYTVLSVSIEQDLGVSRLQVAAAYSGCLVVSGGVARLIGPILDVRGPRPVLLAGALVGPLVFAGIALVDSLASLVFAFALLGVAQALSLYDPAFRAVVDWCPDERTRSSALLGLTIVGGFASAVFLPATTWFVARWGWRPSVIVLAGVLAMVVISTRLLLPLPIRGHARSSIRSVTAPPSVTRLAQGLSLHAVAATGVFLYLMWHLVERGHSALHAAAVAGFAGAAQVPGRILSGPLRRLAQGRSFLALLLGAQGLALLGIVILPGWVATICVFVFGAANGMMTLERAILLVAWYGREPFGSHQGRLSASSGMARALAPFLVEAAHAVTSYAVVFVGLGALLGFGAWACASAAALRAREVRPRASAT